MRRVLAPLVFLLLPAIALAQTWPARPIRMLIGIGAGGLADVVARAITDRVGPALGQPFVLENRPGAGGNVAMEALVRAPADGHTLLFIGPAVTINGSLYKQLAFDPVKDMVHVSLIAWGPYALFVSGTLPAQTVPELVQLARTRADKLNFASVGVGTGGHLAGVLFALATGIEMTHVPYKSIQQAMPDLVSGQVQLVFNAYPPLAPFLQSGKLRMLGFTGSKRMTGFRDVPTVAESGVPGYEATGWYGIFAPAGTPRDVLMRLNAEIQRTLREPDTIERIHKVGFEPLPQTLEEAARFIAADAEKWGRAVRASGATAE